MDTTYTDGTMTTQKYFKRERKKKTLASIARHLVVVLFGRHGDELLGRFGDVVGALDDLLRDQLQVGRGGAVERGLLALAVEPAGAGHQQAESPAHRLRQRLLTGGVRTQCRAHNAG